MKSSWIVGGAVAVVGIGAAIWYFIKPTSKPPAELEVTVSWEYGTGPDVEFPAGSTRHVTVRVTDLTGVGQTYGIIAVDASIGGGDLTLWAYWFLVHVPAGGYVDLEGDVAFPTVAGVYDIVVGVQNPHDTSKTWWFECGTVTLT